MGRTGRADGWRHDKKKALAGDGFGGQGRAMRHRATIEQSATERGSVGREMLVERWGELGGAARAGRCPGPPTRYPLPRSRQRSATCWAARQAYRLDGETPDGIHPYL